MSKPRHKRAVRRLADRIKGYEELLKTSRHAGEYHRPGSTSGRK